MKTILNISALTFLLGVIVTPWAKALSFDISEPQLAFPERTPPETEKQVIKFLNKEVTFVHGGFMNEFLGEGFSGSTAKLNDLIQLLHTCRFELKLEFADFKNDGVSFGVSQNTRQPEELTININTAKKDLKWSELKIQIPPAKAKVEPDAVPKKAGPNKPL